MDGKDEVGFFFALHILDEMGVEYDREKVLAHAAVGNPQEGEDTALANALFDQLLIKMDIGDQKEGYGFQHAANWEAWQKSLLASGALKEPLDLSQSVLRAVSAHH